MSSEIEIKMPLVAPGIFSLPAGDGFPPQLLGGLCPACQRHFFPRPRYCPVCLGPLEEVSLGATGTIYSFTVVRIKPPLGLPRPYSIGYVDLDDAALRIFCLLDPNSINQLQVGLPVELAVGPIGHDVRGAVCLRPFFKPRKND